MDLPVFKRVKEWLSIYFSGKNPAFTPPLAPKGSPFRQAVWKILREIPYGKVITYGDIAKKIAKQSGKEKMSAQAAGGAVGHNPITLIIPCHRVVGADGSLTGYAGGITAKTKLLTLERVDMSKLHTPRKGTAL
jgi:methylated-DNA-[protein]-cysteine S-methyltransferase